MIRLTLMNKNSRGCHVLDLWRTEHGDVSLSVFEKSGGPQFDFELDDSDLEILSIMIEKAKRLRAELAGGGE
jgi:hypothetical protein